MQGGKSRIIRFITTAVMALSILSVFIAKAEAEGWVLHLNGSIYGPQKFLAVNKNLQQLYLVEHQSPSKVVRQLPCTTGQEIGDKFEEGDLKTPEGVYFIRTRLDSGLDYELYGNLAYTLDFPNPIDRLNGKTGSGIWLHGRGNPIVPRETKGCIAMNTGDLINVEGLLEPGMPVVVAREVNIDDNPADAKEIRQVIEAVDGWAQAWESESNEFFDYYLQERFARASNLSFERFRRHKENVFHSVPWVMVEVFDLKVLAGPDYWVSYFDQYYRTVNLTSSGTKRLYWQKDAAGRLGVVAEEWIPGAEDLGRRYLAQMQGKAESFIHDWIVAWQNKDLDEYIAFYDSDIRQQRRYGLDAVKEHKQDIWQETSGISIDIDNIQVDFYGNGLQIRFRQYYKDNDYEDKGYKTLVLDTSGDRWLIVGEQWSAM